MLSVSFFLSEIIPNYLFKIQIFLYFHNIHSVSERVISNNEFMHLTKNLSISVHRVHVTKVSIKNQGHRGYSKVKWSTCIGSVAYNQ